MQFEELNPLSGTATGRRGEQCFSARCTREVQTGAAGRSRWSPAVRRGERERLKQVQVRRQQQEDSERARLLRGHGGLSEYELLWHHAVQPGAPSSGSRITTV